MTNFASLLRAIAALLWPLIVLGTVIIFKPEITSILRHLQEAEIFGQRLRLDKPLAALAKQTASLEEEMGSVGRPATKEVAGQTQSHLEHSVTASTTGCEAASPTMDPDVASETGSNVGDHASDPHDYDDVEDIERQVLEDAKASPKLALLQLSTALERVMRRVLASSGWGKPAWPGLVALARALDGVKVVPPGFLSTVRSFADIRNTILHSSRAVSDNDILRAIDSGLTILRTVSSIPLETHVVEHPMVDLYEDAEGVHPRTDVHGVMLRSSSPRGLSESRRVFPTTRIYEKGWTVSWEWNTGMQWGETWYRDPWTHELKEAWGGSLEFVGRSLDDLLG